MKVVTLITKMIQQGWRVTVVLTVFLLASMGFQIEVYAESPTIIFAKWSELHQCPDETWGQAVLAIHGQYDIDSWTRDALPGEAQPDWSQEGLKANAVAARSIAWYFYHDRERNAEFHCSYVPDIYHLTTRQVQGWSYEKMVQEGNQAGFANNRVTETMLEVLVDSANQPVFFDWWTSHQEALENASGTYTNRLNTVYPQYHVARIDQLDPSFSLDSRFRSMTNGTNPPAQPGWTAHGTYYSGATSVNTPREAEVRWGMRHIDTHRDNPFGQPGTYMLGPHTGDLIEFVMYFGEPYRYLHLIGISDRPSPVYVNIYIDGLYRGNIPWAWDDNQRHLIIKEIPGIPYGQHAIAIQFRNDQYGGGVEDLDRDFFLDVIGVSN